MHYKNSRYKIINNNNYCIYIRVSMDIQYACVRQKSGYFPIIIITIIIKIIIIIIIIILLCARIIMVIIIIIVIIIIMKC